MFYLIYDDVVRFLFFCFRYHIHINCDQHLQTCLLSSYFLRSIFFYTLPHSEHDIDYATLIIEHSLQIWPSIQLVSDEFRLNPRALMDALAYTCDGLIQHDICLHVSEFEEIIRVNRRRLFFSIRHCLCWYFTMPSLFTVEMFNIPFKHASYVCVP